MTISNYRARHEMSKENNKQILPVLSICKKREDETSKQYTKQL